MALYINNHLPFLIILVAVYKISADYDQNPFFNGNVRAGKTNPSNNINLMVSRNPFFQKNSEMLTKLSSNPFLTTVPKKPYIESTTMDVDVNIRRNPFLQTVFTPTSNTQNKPSVNHVTVQSRLPDTNNKPSVNEVVTESRLPSTPVVIHQRNNNTEQILENICGTSVIRSLAVGGETIRLGEYPWLAALWIMDKDRYVHFQCGGSIISDKHVVTAAHCVYDVRDSPEKIVFYIGYTNISWSSYSLNAEKGVIQSSKIYVHPKYKGVGAEGDIAIVKLQKPVTFSPFIRPLCLWPRKYKVEFNSIVNFTGQVAGWGTNENGKTNLEIPTSVRMPTVSKATCLWSDDGYYNLVTDETFCAGRKDGKGPCNGDSGSSFILQIDGRWVLRGVVSHSLPSKKNQYLCDLERYIVFADAAMYLDWFDEIMKKD